jgi:predicted amidohydrolase YtcJ
MPPSTIYIYFNGPILTMDAHDSIVEAMAVYKEHILVTGTEKRVRKVTWDLAANADPAVAGPYEFVDVDLHGACVVPGFIDSHMHPGFYVYYKTQLNLNGIQSYATLGKVLQEEDARRPPGEWIVGVDLMENVFELPRERVFPDRHVLDTMCPQRPVIIIRHDGHICSVNTPALQVIGIDASNVKAKTAPDGEIQVDKEGNPTGIFTESATAFAMACIPLPTSQRLKDACKRMSAELASFGITTCGGILQTDENGPGGKTGAVELSLTQVLIKEDLIAQDFVFFLSADRPKILARIDKAFQKLDGGRGRFIVGGLKIYVDGTFGASTACMFAPFADSPEGKSGFLVISEERLRQLIKETCAMGYQVACHAIGDKANRVLVSIYQELVPDNSRARCRVEHASILTADTIADAAIHHIILACQPGFLDSEYQWLERRLGPDRVKHTYPFKAIFDAGICLAGASDSPVESANVLKALCVCVTRNGLVPEEGITIMQALRMFTYNAAYALRQETVKGSLEPGKLADFVVLAKDPRMVPAGGLPDIKINATYHRGKLIHSS